MSCEDIRLSFVWNGTMLQKRRVEEVLGKHVLFHREEKAVSMPFPDGPEVIVAFPGDRIIIYRDKTIEVIDIRTLGIARTPKPVVIAPRPSETVRYLTFDFPGYNVRCAQSMLDYGPNNGNIKGNIKMARDFLGAELERLREEDGK